MTGIGQIGSEIGQRAFTGIRWLPQRDDFRNFLMNEERADVAQLGATLHDYGDSASRPQKRNSDPEV